MEEDLKGKKVLSVLAHPDDESFGMGGTLALYAERGAEVHLICATRGEVGEVAPDFLEDYASIGELREAELQCAAGHLGLKHVHFLGYRDSGMPGSPENAHPRALTAAPLEEVTKKIRVYIQEFRPHLVLTFDPIGGYRHPDHVIIHQAATRAFQLFREAHQPDQNPSYRPQGLYYHTISKRYLRFAVRFLRLLGRDPSRWGKNEDIDLTALAAEEFPVHARVDYGQVAERKKAAAVCHASQSGSSLIGGIFAWLSRLFIQQNQDLFMQAYPAPAKNSIKEDLFWGI